MRHPTRAFLAITVACAWALVPVGDGVVRSASPVAPQLTATIESFRCNPGGPAGIEVTASATAVGTTLARGELWIGQLETVSSPTYVPFAWTGLNTANWFSADAYPPRGGPATETRTLRTSDATTWNTGNVMIGVWDGAHIDSWWLIQYHVTSAGQRSRLTKDVGWYIHCPDGATTSLGTLAPMDYTTVTGGR